MQTGLSADSMNRHDTDTPFPLTAVSAALRVCVQQHPEESGRAGFMCVYKNKLHQDVHAVLLIQTVM